MLQRDKKLYLINCVYIEKSLFLFFLPCICNIKGSYSYNSLSWQSTMVDDISASSFLGLARGGDNRGLKLAGGGDN